MSQKTYIVNGMTCQHCVKNVQMTLEAVPGVSHVQVQLMPPRAIIDSEEVSLDVLTQALSETKFTIQAMGA